MFRIGRRNHNYLEDIDLVVVNMSNTQVTLMQEWKTINWRKVERIVFKLQKRIYQASQDGNVKVMRRLQRTLSKSWYAKLLAIRKVTQDNNGKKTAGVDGKLIQTGKQRIALAQKLKIDGKASPLRRVWIPKPGKNEKRGLGIPTIEDRAKQTLVKMILEPEWEAKMEPCSYGFRPGRSAQDAMYHVWTATKMDKWILDADIKKCFDQIDHKVLLEKIGAAPTIQKQIKAWLQSGILDENAFAKTKSGTPQGGTISPLLANIALDGLEKMLKKAFPYKNKGTSFPPYKGKEGYFLKPILIRYADDFLFIHDNKKVIEDAIPMINEWLNKIGLNLNLEKTKIVDLDEGFDFLGFNVKCYSKREGKIRLIQPSAEAIKRHSRALKDIVNKYKSAPQGKLIKELNSVVRGWTNYYGTQVSSEVFSKLKNQLYHLLWSWAKFTCPGTGKKKLRNRYWHKVERDNWRFAEKKKGKIRARLFQHTDARIVRHSPIKTTKSPFDGDWIYWSLRMSRNYTGTSPKIAYLLKQQNGKCNKCFSYLKNDDLMEIDHIIPRVKGGTNKYKNLQLLHRHCHHNKTREDRVKYS